MSDRFLTTVRLKMLKLTVAGGNDSEKALFPKITLYRWEKKVTHLVYMDVSHSGIYKYFVYYDFLRLYQIRQKKIFSSTDQETIHTKTMS